MIPNQHLSVTHKRNNTFGTDRYTVSCNQTYTREVATEHHTVSEIDMDQVVKDEFRMFLSKEIKNQLSLLHRVICEDAHLTEHGWCKYLEARDRVLTLLESGELREEQM